MLRGWLLAQRSRRSSARPPAVALGCLLAVWLVACASPAPSSPAQAPPASGPGAAAPASPPIRDAGAPTAPAAVPPARNITISMPGVDLNYLPHRIAQVKGFYREAGFDVEIQLMPGNVQLAAVAAGEVAFAASGGSAMRAASRGVPLRLVDCHGIRPIYYLVLAPGVQAVTELGGKGFAVGNVGSDTLIVARDLIRKYGGDPGTVEYRAFGSSNVRFAAVASGQVAGGILLISDAIRAREASLTIVNTAEDMPIACDMGVATSQAWIAERPQEVRHALRAVHRAVQLMRSDRAEAIRILAEWQQADEQQAAAAYDAANVQVSYSTDKAVGQQAIEQALAYGKELEEIEPQVRLVDVADLSFYD
jgi:ABC-type nitrate/sulfonate/bicarbonate transport system substrate-binding protein